MDQQPQSDDLVQRYLLGLATEAECDQVELSYFSNDDTEYERLGVAEDELIDNYLDGLLDVEEKRGFEGHFLTAPERRDKLDFARVLRERVIRATTKRGREAPATMDVSWFRAALAFGSMKWAATAALVVAMLGGGLALLQTRRLSKEAFVARSEKQTLIEENRGLRRELEASRQTFSPSSDPRSGVAAVVSAVLTPGLTRSGGTITLVSIPPQAQLAQFTLQLLTTDYRSYRAFVRTAVGDELLSQSHLRPNSRLHVIVLVPATLLRSGDYQILLAGETSSVNYEPRDVFSFRVVR